MRPFRRESHNRERGGRGEDEAIRRLLEEGYRIVERNVRTRVGEIDVVARDGDTLCFVEIKARSGPQHGPAIAAVDSRKQRRIAGAASLYLQKFPTTDPCRFDVVGLDGGPGGWTFTLVKDAFRLS